MVGGWLSAFTHTGETKHQNRKDDMSYTQEEIEKAFKVTQAHEAEFWAKCAEHVIDAVQGLIGSTHTSKITIFGSWYFTIWGFERGFIGNAVVEIDNGVSIGFIRRITFISDLKDGLQKEFTYVK